MSRFFREPLIHFLIIGLGIFLLFHWTANQAGGDDRTIEVSRGALLNYLQFRSKAFQPEAAVARFDALSPEEFEQLVDDYVKEEALYREALALGMDKNDYVIKQRLIQSIRFVTDGLVAPTADRSQAELETYYNNHRDQYSVKATVTFTHVFLSAEPDNHEAMQGIAAQLLNELNANRIPFSGSAGHGDRFVYHLNYVERDADLIASHFGPAMAQQLFELAPDDSRWQGPLKSPFGFHLVLLTRHSAGRYAELAEVESRVRRDAEHAEVALRKAQAVQAIVESYSVNRLSSLRPEDRP